MASTEELTGLVALLRRGDRSWSDYAELVESAGSALAVFHGEYHEEDVAEKLFQPAQPETDLDTIRDEIQAWLDEGIKIVTVLDEDYPTNLRTIYNRPPLLFYYGELREADSRSIAVVGTRKPTKEGLTDASTIAGELADAGVTVVSGLAAGIDTAAHLATLDRCRRTLAVIGTGLRRTFPEKNADLQRKLAMECAVISQFWPDAPPTRRTFPLRNIVMSGLALATVVIEASNTSGARMQARFALDHGHPVFLMSSLLRFQWAKEYEKRPGTFVVQSAEDILTQMERLTPLGEALATS